MVTLGLGHTHSCPGVVSLRARGVEPAAVVDIGSFLMGVEPPNPCPEDTASALSRGRRASSPGNRGRPLVTVSHAM